MKKIMMVLLSLMIATGTSACSPEDSPPGPEQPGQSGGNDDPGTDPNVPDSDDMNLLIKTGPATFTATLTDNATAQAFKALLPMSVTMHDLNSNEKYCDLPGLLPTAASNPGTIRSGDIMLYGGRTLVLFYKTFSTSYAYTRIGTVDDPAGLKQALGTESVRLDFEIIESTGAYGRNAARE